VGALGFSLAERPALASQIVTAINQVRRGHRLPTVTAYRPLARAALAHVRALAVSGLFTHEWSDGTPFATWILRYFPQPPRGSWMTGENLIWSSTPLTASAAVSAWLASPEHRRIMLDPTWRQLGIGAVASNEAPGVYGGADAVVVAADFGTTSTR